MDRRPTQKQMTKIAAQHPEMSARDLRDLLMEHGADGITASEQVAGRLADEHARDGR